ncbi:MAG: 16S rRNA (adenine(1518)-N(6)/adenine(1519)-N(6))-dimethyltransferase RsmA [Burkholderiales bacterium]|nr:16S rRNA (adenine(1518)-N(6)/adenine(1519)-N(6))-dimethyltransferase RsmA [Burkholderiales bacterium]
MRPRKRFGQHFLTDRTVIDRIIAAVAPQPDDIVVEIGPGRGALTGPLAERLRHLHVIEIDRDLAQSLAARFPPERVTVHTGDALAFDFALLPSPLRLVGNLPYNISTPLLFRLIPFAARIRDAHFMLQLEVVERMVAAPSTAAYGRLSVMLQYRFAMERIARVRPGAFHPAPKVESAVVRMIPRPQHALGARDATVLSAVVTAAFTKRRKTLRNALAGIADAAGLEALGIDPQLRPENLAVADYVGIANAVAVRGADGSGCGRGVSRAG